MYLEAISDPKHEQHADLVEWRGPGFDPNTVDDASIRKELAKLAKKWAGETGEAGRKEQGGKAHKAAAQSLDQVAVSCSACELAAYARLPAAPSV